MKRRERDKMTGIIMAGNRWDNLDFEPPSRGRHDAVQSDVGDRPPVQTGSTSAPDSPLHATQEGELVAPVVTQARGVYVLRNYQAVVDLLEPQLATRPDLAGGQRVLAHALAQLDRKEEAIER